MAAMAEPEPEDATSTQEETPDELRQRVAGKVVAGASWENSQLENAEQHEREPGCVLFMCLSLVAMLEGFDSQLIGISLPAFQKDLGMHIKDHGNLILIQTVLTNLAAPFWGVLADRESLKRKNILIIGALGQAISVFLTAFTPVIWPMYILRAASGICLATQRPVVNGIIADVTSDNRRGKIFGRVQSMWLLGQFASTLIAGNIAELTIFQGVQGWRFSFFLCGLLASATAATLLLCMTEPPHQSAAKSTGCRAVLDELLSLLRFFTIPTFCIMVMQGIFGTIPWSVMAYAFNYFRLTGLSKLLATILTAEGTFMGIFGNVIGGLIADCLARRLGYHGRPLSAQITVAIGIPLIYLWFYGVPAGEGTFAGYFFIIAGFGLLATWAQSGTNFPILSDIVPSKDRGKVMAWEIAVENSIAFALGPVVVTRLAADVFGYEFDRAKLEAEGRNLDAADALGKAMTFTMCLPWIVTFLAYSVLHWSYPRDMRKLKESREQEAAAMESEASDGSDAASSADRTVVC
eukprot:gb/GFBE01055907.1/.p1 GENE.gb/GFBE01055907.1/~~gb/GFBE01055907.1/.p1  ORF type:complete len:521 (+),score=106.98 gb/GFBE01055907.1/:1-1563(+)